MIKDTVYNISNELVLKSYGKIVSKTIYGDVLEQTLGYINSQSENIKEIINEDLHN